ncbi:hypothetical protein Celaphus_00013619, partial [Cervus elaphus hippelaphus]
MARDARGRYLWICLAAALASFLAGFTVGAPPPAACVERSPTAAGDGRGAASQPDCKPNAPLRCEADLGWLSKPLKDLGTSADSHQNLRWKLISEMKADNIKSFLRFSIHHTLSHHQTDMRMLRILYHPTMPFHPRGELVYVNYARTEDFFKLEREMNINCTGKIVIARYGKIFRGNKVKNAMSAGAKGIILYSDPADYSAPGVQPYPKGWNLPGTAAQRGNVLNLNGAGDPLTPGYPAK